jgi:tRNA (cmo5U34)-methyltransferase
MTNSTFDFDSDYGRNFERSANETTFGYNQLFTLALAHLSQHAPDDCHALIVGPGPGLEFVQFGKDKPNWHFTGVDPSEQMLKLAREKVDTAGLKDSVTLIEGYLDDLLTGPQFNAAIAVRVMHFLPDDGSKLKFLENVFSQLHAGSAFALFDVTGNPSSKEFKLAFNAWKQFMEFRGKSHEETEQISKAAVDELNIISEERTLDLLAEAGFGDMIRFYATHVYRGWIAIKK